MPEIVNLENNRKTEACGQTVLPDRSISIGRNIDGKCQNSIIQMRHFGDFQIFYFARYARKISLTPFLVIFALCVAQEKHSRESLAN